MKKFIFIYILLFLYFNINASDNMPKPYMFYLEIPLELNAQMPMLNIKAFVSGYNNETTKYIYIVLVEDSEDDEAFRQWVYYIIENSPVSVIMEEVGNNTSNVRYDFVRPLIQ